jgi:uncharacterized membrane protein YeiH
VSSSTLLLTLDLVGTAAFALAGALAAVAGGFDLFGVIALAVVNAIAGGLVRDAVLGATPAAALRDWRYLTIPLVCALVVFIAHPAVARASGVIVMIDALGLGIFAAAGAQKALRLGIGPIGVVALGVVTAVGGGVMRDVLTREVPTVLHKEIYALPAALGALLVVVGDRSSLRPTPVAFFAVAVACVLRIVAYRRQWNLPKYRDHTGEGNEGYESGARCER